MELHVYPLPSDHSVVVGKTVYGEPLGYGHHWYMGRLDVPIAEAFLSAARVADEQGIPFLWVNDPHKLFPPNKRPSLGLVETSLPPSEPKPPSEEARAQKSKGVMSLIRTKTDKMSRS